MNSVSLSYFKEFLLLSEGFLLPIKTMIESQRIRASSRLNSVKNIVRNHLIDIAFTQS
jgi:hypothetical protein